MLDLMVGVVNIVTYAIIALGIAVIVASMLGLFAETKRQFTPKEERKVKLPRGF